MSILVPRLELTRARVRIRQLPLFSTAAHTSVNEKDDIGGRSLGLAGDAVWFAPGTLVAVHGPFLPLRRFMGCLAAVGVHGIAWQGLAIRHHYCLLLFLVLLLLVACHTSIHLRGTMGLICTYLRFAASQPTCSSKAQSHMHSVEYAG